MGRRNPQIGGCPTLKPALSEVEWALLREGGKNRMHTNGSFNPAFGLNLVIPTLSGANGEESAVQSSYLGR